MNRGHDILSGLPGETFGRQGLADLNEGRDTVACCLVEMALPRLEMAGIPLPPPNRPAMDSEHRLYRHLEELGDGAYARYNSLPRELTSFQRALESRVTRAHS